MIPQLIIIILGILGLGMEIAKHGETRKKEYNGWIHLIAMLILWIVLYFGGFWEGLI